MRILATFALVAPILALAIACAPTTAPPVAGGGQVGGMTGEDTCGMAQHARLFGVHERDINRASLPPGARVICATCLVTQDYSAQRLNLHLSADGRVSSMRCG
jgi:hypothetical protein